MSETKFKYGIETPSKITFENYGVRYTWETDHSDLTLDEVLDAFYKNRPVKNTKSSALCMKQDIFNFLNLHIENNYIN